MPSSTFTIARFATSFALQETALLHTAQTIENVAPGGADAHAAGAAPVEAKTTPHLSLDRFGSLGSSNDTADAAWLAQIRSGATHRAAYRSSQRHEGPIPNAQLAASATALFVYPDEGVHLLSLIERIIDADTPLPNRTMVIDMRGWGRPPLIDRRMIQLLAEIVEKGTLTLHLKSGASPYHLTMQASCLIMRRAETGALMILGAGTGRPDPEFQSQEIGSLLRHYLARGK